MEKYSCEQIVSFVWQKKYTPQEAFKHLKKNKFSFAMSDEYALELLESVAKHEINVPAFIRKALEKNHD